MPPPAPFHSLQNIVVYCCCPFCALTQEARKASVGCNDLTNFGAAKSSAQQAMK